MTLLADIDLGIGTWQWGDRLFWGYGGDYDDAGVRSAFFAAVQRGVRLFDTAEIYGMGKSERLLGQFLAQTEKPVYVATKFMPFPWRFTSGQLLNALRASLRRLGLAQVDLYQMHWPSSLVPPETWMGAMIEAAEAGLLRAVGVSNYDREATDRAQTALGRYGLPLTSNQVPYSLLNRDIEKNGLLQHCLDANIRVIAYSPLEQGLLSGRYKPGSPPPGVRGLRYSQQLATIQPLVEALREMGEGRDKTPAQVALNWCICKGTLPIPGAKHAGHAEQSAGALGWRLTDEEVVRLDHLSDKAMSR